MVMVKLLKVTPVMRMMKNITQRVLCLKVGKENIKVTTLYEQSEEVKHLRRRMTTKVREKL